MFKKCTVRNKLTGIVYEGYVDTNISEGECYMGFKPYLVLEHPEEARALPELIDGGVFDLSHAIGCDYYYSSNVYWAGLDEWIIDNVSPKMQIKIKYFTEDAVRLQKISVGDWIDLYANEDMVIMEGERVMIPLGVAMELPKGYEAHVVPRSSTFKTWGIIMTNSIGIIDNSYCGDNDQWHFPAYCLDGKDADDKCMPFTEIKKGDKICQFRIFKSQPTIEFEEVENLGNADRGGFGSTGSREVK